MGSLGNFRHRWGLCWPSVGVFGDSGHPWGLWGPSAIIGVFGALCRPSLRSLLAIIGVFGVFVGHHRGLWGSLLAIIGVSGDSGHPWGLWGPSAIIGAFGALCQPLLGSLLDIIGVFVGHHWGLWGSLLAIIGVFGDSGHPWGVWGPSVIIGVFGVLFWPSLGFLGTFCPHWDQNGTKSQTFPPHKKRMMTKRGRNPKDFGVGTEADGQRGAKTHRF